jgi:hypothetical protein|tara:strand:+ start:5267 stop:6091 length:825 start_codon:yes stop_codon:yes gene_type:complete
MVVPFTLAFTSETTNTTVTYTSDNITNIQLDFNTPVTPMPLPQMEDRENVLIKVEGNTTTANVSWKIRDRGTTPFTGGGSIYSNADTPLEQIQVFKENFVPITVGDSYVLTIGETIVMTGTLMKMGFSVSSASPVVWDGHFQFIHGNVASSTDNLLADAPVDYSSSATALNVSDDGVTSNPSNGAKINQIKTLNFGSATGITGYNVQMRQTSSSSWSTVPASDIDYNVSATNADNQTLTVEVNDAGSYQFRVSAITSTNTFNKWSPPTSTVTVQ